MVVDQNVSGDKSLVSRVQKIETAQRETLKLFNIAKGDYFLFGSSRP
jgi:hypothetical protein